MAREIRSAEHRILRGRDGRYKYRLKYMVVGDYIKVPDWEKQGSLGHSARSFAKKHPGWDFQMSTLEDGTPVMWRIA